MSPPTRTQGVTLLLLCGPWDLEAVLLLATGGLPSHSGLSWSHALPALGLHVPGLPLAFLTLPHLHSVSLSLHRAAASPGDSGLHFWQELPQGVTPGDRRCVSAPFLLTLALNPMEGHWPGDSTVEASSFLCD